jgi:Spy/CpxP family protein refolding chaperone
MKGVVFMRPQVPYILTAVLVGLLVSPVQGQITPRAALVSLLQDGAGKPLLLANPKVKQEIKLTEEQDNRIRTIIREARNKYEPELRKAGLDRDRLLKVGLEAIQETGDRLNKALPDILAAEQLQRLDQIQVQANGIISFKRPDVQQKLKLTLTQKLQILKIGADLKQQIDEVIKDASSAPLRKAPAAIRKAKELKNVATEKAVQTLTREQKITWKEMNGEPFDLKLELPIRLGRRP